jgi:hypothetical protein
VLQELAPIAHFTFWPPRDACGEELSTPPIVWWTYQQPPEELAEFLRQVVGTFQGTVKWEVLATGRRWILMPARIREYAELHGCNGDLIAAAELKSAEPDFGKRANAELRFLAEHIRYHQKLGGEEKSR